MKNWVRNLLRFVLLILAKAVKLTKTDMDDQLLEVRNKINRCP